MARYLDMIDSPADLKKLTLEQLDVLAQEIRDDLITTLAKTGGHLGPNLGVVELTIAWHYVFNSPTDRIVMDVSHQSYVHKILTGRRSKLHTIRQADGLNGFMLRTESEHDHYGAGHAGTALSAALGMAVGRDLKGTKENVTALCGDAAFTCGVTFEAMNNVTDQTKKLIVILNDNEWSIDKNVGAIASYFGKITTNPRFAHLHDQAHQFIERIGGKVGKTAWKAIRKAEEAAKGMALSVAGQGHSALPSVIFEEMGLVYYGPMDGHDIPTLIKAFEFLKEQEHPVLLHVLTQKGRGFDLALEKQKKFHGVGPNAYEAESGTEVKASGQPTYSQIFGETMCKLADSNRNIVGITGAMPNGTGLEIFQAKHRDRYYDVGIAEEHAVLFAAGLATQGLKPVCAIYSTFLQRAIDCIIHDVCLQNLPVIFCMDRGSLSPDDGPTHHGLFDISYLRSIPNMVHMQPKDEDEFVDMMFTAVHYNGPIAMRYPRGTGPGAKIKDQPRLLEIGKAEVIKHGKQVAFFGLGNMLQMALKASEILEAEGVSCAIINPRFIKPLDAGTLEFFGRSVDLICTLEDHVLKGGFGSAVIEELSDLGIQTPVVRIGWPDRFIDHGKLDLLREKNGMTVQATVEKVRAALNGKAARASTVKAA